MLRISALMLSLAISVAVAASEKHTVLLYDAFATTELHESAATVTRSRFVAPHFAALEPPLLLRGQREAVEKALRVALFDDVVVHVALESVERNAIDAIAWSGRVEGDATSSVTLVVKDDQLVASLATRGRQFAIEPRAGGVHEVIEIDQSAFPDGSDPVAVGLGGTPHEWTVRETEVKVESAPVIDILVAYTDDLRASLGSTAATEAAATAAVEATNVAFVNSGVVPRMRLVGTLEISYADNAAFGTVLEQLRARDDGEMDEVHPMRDHLGADVVVLLTLYGGTSCGAAFVMRELSPAFGSSAFAVVPNRCAVADLAFPHELGHLFGLEHDRYAAGALPAYPYGYGYVDVERRFRDIMAYRYACDGCPRIQYFSNPSLTYQSRALGISVDVSRATAADGVRALNNAAPVVANWRPPAAPGSNGPGRTRAVGRRPPP